MPRNDKYTIFTQFSENLENQLFNFFSRFGSDFDGFSYPSMKATFQYNTKNVFMKISCTINLKG